MWKVGGIKIELAIIGRQSFWGEAREISEKRKFLLFGPLLKFLLGENWLRGSFAPVLVAQSRVRATKCDLLAKL